MKPGTRVRKVRSLYGHGIGATGRYVGPAEDGPRDCEISMDQPWVSISGCHWPAGSLALCRLDQWEPIVPEGHQPAEETVEELLPFLKGVSA